MQRHIDSPSTLIAPEMVSWGPLYFSFDERWRFPRCSCRHFLMSAHFYPNIQWGLCRCVKDGNAHVRPVPQAPGPSHCRCQSDLLLTLISHLRVHWTALAGIEQDEWLPSMAPAAPQPIFRCACLPFPQCCPNVKLTLTGCSNSVYRVNVQASGATGQNTTCSSSANTSRRRHAVPHLLALHRCAAVAARVSGLSRRLTVCCLCASQDCLHDPLRFGRRSWALSSRTPRGVHGSVRLMAASGRSEQRGRTARAIGVCC